MNGPNGRTLTRRDKASISPPRIPALLMCVLFGLSGCLRQQASPVGLEGSGRLYDFRPAGASAPCNLFSKEEVDLALNSVTGVTSMQGRPILAGMSMCSLNGPNKSVAAWGVLSGARSKFEDYARLNRGYLETIKVAGSDGVWDRDVDTLIVLRGERAFGIRLAAAESPAGKGRVGSEHLKQICRLMAIRAFGRL